MIRTLLIFVIRWVLNSVGLWVAVSLLGTGYDAPINVSMAGYLIAGLIFSIINSVLKPIIVILSIPAILMTLGLFMIVVNGVLVYISLQLAPGIHMTFFNSILTGIILSLVNYIVSAAVSMQSDR